MKQQKWPEHVKPQLALLVDEVPRGDRFIHEVKFDGYRTLVQIRNQSVRLLTRSGLDWTEKYHPLDLEFKKLKVRSAILDGEIVALNSHGHSDFSALQEAIKGEDMTKVVFYAFDLLFLNGEDLRSQPLEQRKKLLKKILAGRRLRKIIFSRHETDGDKLLAQITKQGLEGIVSKDRHMPYQGSRNGSWQKIKTSKKQEFVIGAYTDPEGSRQGLGALLMGVYEDDKLRYVGRVGTGFNQKNTPDLMRRLKKLQTSESPFILAEPPRSRKIHWVRPELLAEVEFKAWTGDGNLRHASFQALRFDKPKKEVRGEEVVKITHPERIVYPEDDVRKIDVANYYRTVSPWLLPYLEDRPLSLLRCPERAGENCFFQKHTNNAQLTKVSHGKIRDQEVATIQSADGLLQLVQWGMLEPHAWQCRMQKANHPDQIVFDLDPDENLSFKQVAETSLRLQDLLLRLNLKSFLKTTGGKGLHLHVPINSVYSWEDVKAFSKTVCQQLEAEYPGQYTTNLLKKTRKGKIFLDYLRNGFGATAVAPYSLRAKQHPSVAVPVEWAELKDLSGGDQFDLRSSLRRLAAQKRDPWKGFLGMKQKISILKPAAK